MSKIDSRSQKQRTAARKRLDREDSIKCSERANFLCEVCCAYSPYGEYCGSMHHFLRKGSDLIRHDQRYHVWLCSLHHAECHGSYPQDINDTIAAVIAAR